MNKDKLINGILNEWAMRSPDGFASGYSTVENMNVLRDLLEEYSLPIDEINKLILAMTKN